MFRVTWEEAVRDAIERLCQRTGSKEFSRQQLLESELDRIIIDTGSKGRTPDLTVSRVLQELRDAGEIDFLDRGRYRCR